MQQLCAKTCGFCSVFPGSSATWNVLATTE
ncbi:hypothetical protein K9N68_30360 [Kovacikia minuta CCNUW1]|nr:hypothetical protein K9N68_30360 [Kovacikia minuta CCNUW1]